MHIVSMYASIKLLFILKNKSSLIEFTAVGVAKNKNKNMRCRCI